VFHFQSMQRHTNTDDDEDEFASRMKQLAAVFRAEGEAREQQRQSQATQAHAALAKLAATSPLSATESANEAVATLLKRLERDELCRFLRECCVQERTKRARSDDAAPHERASKKKFRLRVRLGRLYAVFAAWSIALRRHVGLAVESPRSQRAFAALLLEHAGLATHRFNRGMFVANVTLNAAHRDEDENADLPRDIDVAVDLVPFEAPPAQPLDRQQRHQEQERHEKQRAEKREKNRNYYREHQLEIKQQRDWSRKDADLVRFKLASEHHVDAEGWATLRRLGLLRLERDAATSLDRVTEDPFYEDHTNPLLTASSVETTLAKWSAFEDTVVVQEERFRVGGVGGGSDGGGSVGDRGGW
jgi:hypothetical protein